MPRNLNLDDLKQAVRPGEAVTLSSVTRLAPAAGSHASIAPARYTQGKTGVYAYETRFVDGEPVTTVLVDAKSSAANRLETAIQDAIDDGHPLFSLMPRVEVTYTGDGVTRTFSDLTLPHRLFDAHIRAGTVDGVPTTQVPAYVAARNSNPTGAWDIMQLSPITVAFGGWDSHRKANQGRYPSLLVGEIIGVVADQDPERMQVARHSGARVDPVAAGLDIKQSDLKAMVELQKDELGKSVLEKAAGKKLKPSELGFGSIPPGVEALAGIATSEIIRSHVLSFALLRRLRFGRGPDGDASIRALLAAVLLNALARSDSELYLRANAHLVEASAPEVKIDLRAGKRVDLKPLTIDVMDELLEHAYAEARDAAGVSWTGQVLKVTGNPVVVMSADDSSSDE